MQDGEMIDINDPYFNEPQPYSYIPELSPYDGVAGTGSITNNPLIQITGELADLIEALATIQ